MNDERLDRQSAKRFLLRKTGRRRDVLQCRARGIFKKKGITPLVGDRVIYEVEKTGEGTVIEIEPRSSELVRPPIANVDTVVLVFSVAEPEVSVKLLDRFLVHTELSGLETLICFSKHDLSKRNVSLPQAVKKYEQIGYEVLITSAKERVGTDELMKRLVGHISVFAGQSGVGKSTLLNAMVPGLNSQTNVISRKLGRGRHTTRHVELIALPEGGWIADTPGFSQLDLDHLEPEQLALGFREFQQPNVAPCKFRGCLHTGEPGCGVKIATEAGQIDRLRYEHYEQFLQELQEVREKRRRY